MYIEYKLILYIWLDTYKYINEPIRSFFFLKYKHDTNIVK